MKKRIICFILVLSMILIVPISSSAVQSNSEMTNITNISTELSNTLLDKITQKIQLTIEIDETCPWDNTTAPGEVIPTYDLSDTVNGYIINLETNGNPTGYFMYALSSEGEADLVEFCYDGRYLIEGEPVTSSSELGQETLYFAGPSAFLTKEANNYYIAGTDEKIASDAIPQVQDSMMQARFTADANLDTSNIQPYANKQVVHKDVKVPLLTGVYNFEPKTMSDFPTYENHCAPVCCINMLKYWCERRSIPNLYESGDTTLSVALIRMASKIGFVNHEGIDPSPSGYRKVDSGFADYINYYGYTPYKGGGCKAQKDITWSWLTTNINNGNALFLGTLLEGYYYAPPDTEWQHHAFFVVGYQETTETNGDYLCHLRVADGYSVSLSRFLTFTYYSKYFQYAFYYRWM